MLLFRNTEEGRIYFPDFPNSMVNMLVLLTTANYPDVMMPAYNASRPSVLFFMSFLLVGLFFCMNLVLASVYNNYKLQMTERALVYHRKRREGLSAAFRKLDTNQSGFVRIASCARLLGELTRPSISMFNWEMSRYTVSKKTEIMLQSWWDKVIDERLSHLSNPTNSTNSTNSTNFTNSTNSTNSTDSKMEMNQNGSLKLNGIREEEENNTNFEKEEKNQFQSQSQFKHHRQTSSLASITMERPVDDLIPLDAFCDMMISVEQAKDLHKLDRKRRKRYSKGLCYVSTNTCCIHSRNYMNSYVWDWCVATIVVINTLIIIVEADIDAQLPNGSPATNGILLCENLNMVFGSIYIFEMIFKIVVLGGSKYWSRLQHRFDTFTVICLVVGQIIQIIMKSHNIPLSDVAQWILLLRLTRTLRLVVVVRRFNEIFNIFIELLPAFSTLFGMVR